MKLGFVIPIVGPAIGGAPGLTAFCADWRTWGRHPLGR
jgi:hypothetical protein